MLRNVEGKYFLEKKEAIREIVRILRQWNVVEIIEGEVRADHIQVLHSIPPKMSAIRDSWDIKSGRAV